MHVLPLISKYLFLFAQSPTKCMLQKCIVEIYICSYKSALKPGFHMIATIATIIAVATDRSDRCDHMETTLAIVAIVATAIVAIIAIMCHMETRLKVIMVTYGGKNTLRITYS